MLFIPIQTTFISKHLGVQPIMINSALVSGQNRKRCYWTNIPNVTLPDDLGIMLADVLENAVPWQDKGLLNGKSTSYMKNGRKTIVLPEVVPNEYQGKTYYNWKTEGKKK